MEIRPSRSSEKVKNPTPKINSKQNVTWVGTSDSKVLNKDKLEKELNANVSIVRAYCIEEKGRFKENDFSTIVPKILKKKIRISLSSKLVALRYLT